MVILSHHRSAMWRSIKCARIFYAKSVISNMLLLIWNLDSNVQITYQRFNIDILYDSLQKIIAVQIEFNVDQECFNERGSSQETPN